MSTPYYMVDQEDLQDITEDMPLYPGVYLYSRYWQMALYVVAYVEDDKFWICPHDAPEYPIPANIQSISHYRICKKQYAEMQKEHNFKKEIGELLST